MCGVRRQFKLISIDNNTCKQLVTSVVFVLQSNENNDINGVFFFKLSFSISFFLVLHKTFEQIGIAN